MTSFNNVPWHQFTSVLRESIAVRKYQPMWCRGKWYNAGKGQRSGLRICSRIPLLFPSSSRSIASGTLSRVGGTKWKTFAWFTYQLPVTHKLCVRWSPVQMAWYCNMKPIQYNTYLRLAKLGIWKVRWDDYEIHTCQRVAERWNNRSRWEWLATRYYGRKLILSLRRTEEYSVLASISPA